MKTEIASFTEARELLINRDDINTHKEYIASYKSLRTKEGKRLPSYNKAYKDCGWEGMPNFLRGEVKTEITSFTEARELVISRDDINTSKEYNASYKSLRTKDGKRLPANPDKAYKDYGWKGWANFLRVEAMAPLASFTEAKKLILKQSTSAKQRKAA